MSDNKIYKKTASVMLILIMLFSLPCNVYAEHNDYRKQDIQAIIQEITAWKKSSLGNNKSEFLLDSDLISSSGTPSADWYAIAAGRMGIKDNYSSYLAMLKNNIEEKYKSDQKLDPQKATEWHRVSLVILSLGEDPTEVGESKINLIADGTYNRSSDSPLDSQGINGLIWGLITLDSMCFKVPENAADIRQSIIIKMLEKQNPDGSFSLLANSSDMDLTAMALTALSPYYCTEETVTVNGNPIKIRSSIEKAITCLSKNQNNNGGFSDDSGSEAISQTIIALCSLGIDPLNDSRFIKDNCNLLDGLMSYKNNDGGFCHSHDDEKSNSISSEQALLSMISLYRYQNDLRNLYDFRAEMTAEQKSEISEVENMIDNLSVNKRSVIETLERYLKITHEERRYVKNYYLLSEKADSLNIEIHGESLIKVMNKNTNGNGTVINIFNQKNTENITVFNENDIKQFNSLPDKLTTENYNDVIYLFNKLNSAKNKADHINILSSLEEKKAQVEDLRLKIESMNERILKSLYPFDSVSLDDKTEVESIYSDLETMSDYDKKQILGYDDLMKARTKIKTMQRNIIIKVAALIVLLLLVSLLLLRIRKHHMAKKNMLSNENDDW